MLDVIAAHADPILAVVSVVFAMSMLPTLWAQYKARQSSVPLPSSIMTFAGLAVIVVVYASLGLWYAAATATATATCWVIIAAQRFVYGEGEDV